MKKLREKLNNKKGFTLVELIVVIVIILVLSAVLVPNVIKYIEKANKANCKSDAATILTQLQADFADDYAEAVQKGTAFTFTPGTIAGKTGSTTTGITAGSNAATSVDAGKYVVETGEVDGETAIIGFSYGNSNYYVSWTDDYGWSEVISRNP